MEILIDKCKWKYYPGVPEGFALATIDDFHIHRVLKLGKEYLIKWSDRQYYEIREIKPDLKREWLLPFIEANRVFIKK